MCVCVCACAGRCVDVCVSYKWFVLRAHAIVVRVRPNVGKMCIVKE